MDKIKNKTGVVLVVTAITFLLAGYAYGEDFNRTRRNHTSRTLSGTGYGGCINPGAKDFGNYVGRNNTAGTIPGGFLWHMIKKNQYGNRGHYYYDRNRNRDKDQRLDGARGRYDNNRHDRYDRYNRGYYNRPR